MALGAPARLRGREAYDAFAPFYDLFTSHHDYELWTSGLVGLTERHGVLEGSSLLDIGCGTGKSFLPFLERGFAVTACDSSVPMLRHARAKTPDVRLHVADARGLPTFGQFDLVTCLDDVVNYQLERRELSAVFEGAYRNLRAGGTLIFDTNTLHAYAAFFGESWEVDHPAVTWRWHGRTSDPQPGGLVVGDLLLEGADDDRALLDTRHQQRHYSEADIERALNAAGLELVVTVGQFPDVTFEASIDEGRHSKAIYVARRPS